MFCKVLRHPSTACRLGKQHDAIVAEHVLCKDKNNVSRQNETIKRTGPVNNMTEATEIATNADTKVNFGVMHIIIARTKIRFNATVSGFNLMHELVFDISFTDKIM